MKKRIFLLIGTILMMVVGRLSAQDGIKQPDLQTADSYFFDPTRDFVKQTEPYKFGVEWRVEAGYNQNWQHSVDTTTSFGYLHGGQIGAAVDFLLPMGFSLQTGLYYSLSYGYRQSGYRSVIVPTDTNVVPIEYIGHHIYEHNLIIPVRAYYTYTIAKKWRFFFFAGPQLQIGLSQYDKQVNQLSAETEHFLNTKGVITTSHDRYASAELSRVNIQFGLGGGFEWDRLRLSAGYDFGLNNLIRTKVVSTSHMWEWSWYVRMGVRIGKDRKTIMNDKTVNTSSF